MGEASWPSLPSTSCCSNMHHTTSSDCLLCNLITEAKEERASSPLTTCTGKLSGMYLTRETGRDTALVHLALLSVLLWLRFKWQVPFITQPRGSGGWWPHPAPWPQGDQHDVRREQQRYARQHNRMMGTTGRFIRG